MPDSMNPNGNPDPWIEKVLGPVKRVTEDPSTQKPVPPDPWVEKTLGPVKRVVIEEVDDAEVQVAPIPKPSVELIPSHVQAPKPSANLAPSHTPYSGPAPSGKMTPLEEEAITNNWGTELARQVTYDKSLPGYSPEAEAGDKAFMEAVGSGIQSTVSAIAAWVPSFKGVFDRATKGAPSDLTPVGVLNTAFLGLAKEAAKRMGYDKRFDSASQSVEDWSARNDVNAITAHYLNRTDALAASGGRTDDIEKLKPEEREAMRTGLVDKTLGAIERGTTVGGKSYVSILPGALDRYGAAIGPGFISSLPGVAVGWSAGQAVGKAALAGETVPALGKWMTSSKVLAPMMRKIGLSSATKATKALANLTGTTAASASEAVFEAGNVYSQRIKAGDTHEEAAAKSDKVFVANMVLLGFTNNVGPTGKIVRGLIDSGKVEAAEAMAKTIVKDTLKDKLVSAVGAGSKAALEAIKDFGTEGFLEEQGQKVISDLAEQGKPFTTENIIDTYIKNYDEGILGGVIGSLMGGVSGKQGAKPAVNAVEKPKMPTPKQGKPAAEPSAPTPAKAYAPYKASQKEVSPEPAVTPEGPRPESAPAAASKGPIAQEPAPPAAPASGKSALDIAKAETAAGKPQTDIVPIKLHANARRITESDGEANKPENITQHTPASSHTVANRGVAQALRGVMFGALEANGVEKTPDVKMTVASVVNGLSAPGGAKKVAKAWADMGIPQEAIDALNATAAELKKTGIDINKSTMGLDSKPIADDAAATRSWEFLNEFHKQLAPRVQEMGVDAPQWLRGTVARIEGLIKPGGKYDNAYRQGMGMELREAPVESVSTPIVAPVSIGALNKAAVANTPVPKFMEAKNAQEGERPAGPQAAEVKPGEGDNVGAAVAPDVEEGGPAGGPAAAGRGESSGVLEADRAAGQPSHEQVVDSLPPALRARVAKAMELAQSALASEADKGLHAQMLEDTNWGEVEDLEGPSLDAYRWGKKPDGSSGWIQTDKPVPQDSRPETVKPGAVEEVKPIEDPAERKAAVDSAREFMQANHISADDLLTLSKDMGIKVGEVLEPNEIKAILDNIDLEHGTSAPDNRIEEQAASPTYTPGELTAKLVSYMRDGGLSDVLMRLSRNRDFLDAVDAGKRYGREGMRPVSKALIKGEAISPERSVKYWSNIINETEAGSTERYLLARTSLNNLVKGMREKGGDKAIGLSAFMKKGVLSQSNADIVALAIQAANEFMPNFFSISEAQRAELASQELAGGAYDTAEQWAAKAKRDPLLKQAPALLGHFDVRPEEVGSFAPTIDVYEDVKGQYQEKLGTGFEQQAPVKEAQESATGAMSKLFNTIAERGGFTSERLEKSGVPLRPKASHADSHEALVNRIKADPALLKTVGKWTALLGEASEDGRPQLPRYLINNGYATTMLSYITGERKLAYAIGQEDNPKHQTLGQQLVTQINLNSEFGLPTSNHVLDMRKMAILLDENHPLYNATVENTLGVLYSNAHVIMAGVHHSRVRVNGKNMLIPTSRLLTVLSEPSRLTRRAAAGAGKNVATGASNLNLYYNRSSQDIAQRIEAYRTALETSEEAAIAALGESKADRLIMAENILIASRDQAKLVEMEEGSPEQTVALSVMLDPRLMAKLNISVGKMREELGLLRARAKNDVDYDAVYPGVEEGVTQATIPTIVDPTTARDKAQFLGVMSSINIDKEVMELFTRMDPRFFEGATMLINQDGLTAAATFNQAKKLLRVSRNLSHAGASASRVTHIIGHEVGHMMHAFMSLPMLEVIDRWYRRERAEYVKNNPMFEHVMDKTYVPDRDGKVKTIAEIYEERGSGRKVYLNQAQYESLTKAWPDRVDRVGNIVRGIGQHLEQSKTNPNRYLLSKNFARLDGYRFIGTAEFVAETFRDGLKWHARQKMSMSVREKSRKVMTRISQFRQRVELEPGTKQILDHIHRDTGLFIDALVGKKVMQRFIGYQISNGSTDGEASISMPVTPVRDTAGQEASRTGREELQHGPPMDLDPVETAKEDYEAMRNIGKLINVSRRSIMKHLNARSVSEMAWSAADLLNSVLGVANSQSYTMSNMLFGYYEPAAKALTVSRAMVSELKAAAESSDTAKEAKAKKYGSSEVFKGSDGEFYLVDIDSDGKYRNVMPMAVVQSITDFQKTGKFSGPLAGMEAAMQEITNTTWDGLSQATADLAEELSLDPEHVFDLDSHVEFVKNYWPGSYANRNPVALETKWLGQPGSFKPTGKGATGIADSPDANLGMYNSGMNPTDYGVNAGMLFPKTHDTLLDAVKAGFFPSHTNAVEAAASAATNAVGVKARLDMLTSLLRSGMAVPGYDSNPNTRDWPTMRSAVVGLTDDMFGGELYNIRVHPDAMTIVRFGFAPDLLARSEIGRRAAMISGALNSLQLMGWNDQVNAAVAYSQYVTGQNEEERAKLAKKSETAKTFKRAAGMAAAGLVGMAGATAGAAIGIPAVAGSVIGLMTVAGALTVARKFVPMTFNTMVAISTGKNVMQLLGSGKSLHPESLPKSQRELVSAIQAINIKLVESPIQVARTQKLVGDLIRQNRSKDAAFHSFLNVINKPAQFNEIGFRNVGGKLLGKIGAFAMYAPVIMDRYRDSGGNVDFDNKKMLDELNRLSDDLDNQVGAIQYRKLHQNPGLVSGMKLIMRAYGFRYTTERMKLSIAADLMNNAARLAGTAPIVGKHIKGGYEAFREEATGKVGSRPEPAQGDLFAWRRGTIAMKNVLLSLFVVARIEAMASHVLWPESNYDGSDYARDTYRVLRPSVGRGPALAVRGFLSVLPPKGSTLRGVVEHLANEMVAPKFGPDNPNTGAPQRLIVPGGMYMRNVMYEHLLTDPVKWFTSGEGAHIQLGVDLARGKDTFNRPLGFTQPYTSMAWARAYNEYFERKPEDGAMVNAMKAIARDAAYVVSTAAPLSVRSFGKLGDKNEYAGVLPLLTSIGARVQPPEASLSPAEQKAFKMAYPSGGGGEVRSHKSVTLSDRKAQARIEMSMHGTTDLLQAMQDEGLIDHKTFLGEKRKYITKTGEPVPRIVRFLKMAQNDPEKRNWKEVFMDGTANERSMIISYLEGMPPAQGQMRREMRDDLIGWMRKQRNK